MTTLLKVDMLSSDSLMESHTSVSSLSVMGKPHLQTIVTTMIRSPNRTAETVSMDFVCLFVCFSCLLSLVVLFLHRRSDAGAQYNDDTVKFTEPSSVRPPSHRIPLMQESAQQRYRQRVPLSPFPLPSYGSHSFDNHHNSDTLHATVACSTP